MLFRSQGVVDAQFNPVASIYNSKLYEVQDYLAYVNMFYYNLGLITNTALWEKWDPEMQNIIKEAAVAAAEEGNRFTLKEEKRLESKIKEYFKEVTYPDIEPFVEKVKPIYGQINDAAKEPIKEIQDFLKEFRQ